MGHAIQPSHRAPIHHTTIPDNKYYCAAFNKTTSICGPGNIESGSLSLPVPADGGIALAKAALGM